MELHVHVCLRKAKHLNTPSAIELIYDVSLQISGQRVTRRSATGCPDSVGGSSRKATEPSCQWNGARGLQSFATVRL